MKKVTVFLKWIRQELVLVGRGRLWGALRSMDREILSKAGFVPELVQRGPGAWPWRAGSPRDGVKIDEREKPVPMDSFEQLSQMGAAESMNQDSLDARHGVA